MCAAIPATVGASINVWKGKSTWKSLRMREMRTTLSRIAGVLEGIPAVLQRAIRQETDVEVESLVAEAHRVLA